jgi:cyanate permease
MWGFVLTYGFATAARDVIYPLIVSSCFGLRYMAEIYGWLMLALAPGGALGPIFAAAIYDAYQSYQIAFVSFAVLNTLAIATLFFVRDERGRAA